MKFLILPLQFFNLHFKQCAMEVKTLIIAFLISSSSAPTSLAKCKGEYMKPMKPEEPMKLKLKEG